MKNYGNIDLAEGSKILNATIASGTSFPVAASIGELFFITSAANKGIYYYDGDSWECITSEVKLNSAISANAGIKQIKDAADKDDDTLPQYLNTGRGDARYAQISHTHAHSAFGNLSADDHPQYFNQARGDARYSQTSHTHAGYLTGNQTITVDGDASGSGTTHISLTLATTGITAGTYPKVTVDSKGRVTGGQTLLESDIPALDYSKITSGQPAIAHSAIGFTTGTAQIPYDTTIPRITEGTQFASCTISLKSTSSKVKISGHITAESGTAGRTITIALFNGNTAAIAAIPQYAATANQAYNIHFSIIDAPNSLSPTYTLRIGCSGAATWKVNKNDAANGALGGVLASELILEEIQ